MDTSTEMNVIQMLLNKTEEEGMESNHDIPFRRHKSASRLLSHPPYKHKTHCSSSLKLKEKHSNSKCEHGTQGEINAEKLFHRFAKLNHGRTPHSPARPNRDEPKKKDAQLPPSDPSDPDHVRLFGVEFRLKTVDDEDVVNENALDLATLSPNVPAAESLEDRHSEMDHVDDADKKERKEDEVLTEKKFASWTIDDVATWVYQVTESSFAAESFRREEIDGVALPLLSMEDLKDELALKFGPRKKIMAGILQLK